MKELATISSHRLFRDGALLLYEQHESFSLADAQAATAVYSQVIAEEGYLLLLLDFRQGGGADASVRRHLAHWGKANVGRFCIAAVGGNFVLRTTLTLVLTAVRLLGGSQPDLQFFPTLDAGREWLASRREGLSAARRSAQSTQSGPRSSANP